MENETYPNLNRETKWLGIIDYKALIIIIAVILVVWNLVGVFIQSIITKVYIITLIMIPILGLVYSNKSSDNIIHVLYNIFKFLVSSKIYVYRIQSNKQPLK